MGLRILWTSRSDWFWKLAEKLVVLYKLIEGISTMFDFLKDIKELFTRVEALEKKLFHADTAAPTATVAAPTSESPATTPTNAGTETPSE